MGQIKDCPITFHVEPTILALIRKMARTSDQTVSAYLRNLVIRDLTKQGVLTHEVLLVITSMSTTEALEAVEAHAKIETEHPHRDAANVLVQRNAPTETVAEPGKVAW